jgi:hypothetical protein
MIESGRTPTLRSDRIVDLPMKIRDQYRRVLGMFQRLEPCRDDFERIELASRICEEMRWLLTVDHRVLYTVLEESLPNAASVPAAAARLRQAHLLSLVDRLESLSPEDPDFTPIAHSMYESLREHFCVNEREVLPLTEHVPVALRREAVRRMVDLREQLSEH